MKIEKDRDKILRLIPGDRERQGFIKRILLFAGRFAILFIREIKGGR